MIETIRHDYYTDLTQEQAQQRYSQLERQYWDAADYLAALAAERAALLNVMQAHDWAKPQG